MFRKPSDYGARQGNPGKSGHHENHQIYDNVNAGGKFQQPYREPDIQNNHRHNTHGHHKMSPSRHHILSPFPFLHAPLAARFLGGANRAPPCLWRTDMASPVFGGTLIISLSSVVGHGP